MKGPTRHIRSSGMESRSLSFPSICPAGYAATAVSSFALAFLFFAPSVQADAPDPSGCCEENLTCALETKAAVNREFSRGPDLSAWRLTAWKPDPELVPTGAGPASRSFRDPMTGMDFVLVPGACYDTGGKDGYPEEVCIDPYYIGAYEVTYDEYDHFSGATDREAPDDEGWGRGRRPSINVSVYDALNFAKWLSRRTGAHYRLPTEVEWEHAARAGGDTTYPWGNELDRNKANCDGCGSRWDDDRTAPVGSFPPNDWGLYDVAGNVGEWTCFMRDSEPDQSFVHCDSIYKTRRRAFRNGGWSDGPESVEISSRVWNVAMRRSDDVGFRLVRECVECKAGFRRAAQKRIVQETTR